MKKILLLPLSLIAGSPAFCELIPSTPPAPPPAVEPVTAPVTIDTEILSQHWMRSMEEEKPGEKDQIFRPAGSREFPPSRFRMQYKFGANGDCEWLDLVANDAHQLKPGKWSLDPADKSVIRITAEEITVSFRVTALTKEVLRLVPIEPKIEPKVETPPPGVK